MAFLHECQPAAFVRVQSGQHILHHVKDAPFVVHHLFQRYQVGIYLGDSAVHLSRYLKAVARPQQMVHVA